MYFLKNTSIQLSANDKLLMRLNALTTKRINKFMTGNPDPSKPSETHPKNIHYSFWYIEYQ